MGTTVDTVLTLGPSTDKVRLCWCVASDHNTLSLRSQYKMADTPCRRRQPGPGSSVRLSARPGLRAAGDRRDTTHHLGELETEQEVEEIEML